MSQEMKTLLAVFVHTSKSGIAAVDQLGRPYVCLVEDQTPLMIRTLLHDFGNSPFTDCGRDDKPTLLLVRGLHQPLDTNPGIAWKFFWEQDRMRERWVTVSELITWHQYRPGGFNIIPIDPDFVEEDSKSLMERFPGLQRLVYESGLTYADLGEIHPVEAYALRLIEKWCANGSISSRTIV